MALAISASLIGVAPVQSAQLAVTGIIAGDVVTVWREWGTRAELVRGAYGTVAISTAMVLADIAVPFGVVVTYRVQVLATTASTTITVPTVHAVDHVLSDPVTGDYVRVWMLAGPEERTNVFRGSVLRPAGRSRGVAVYDVRGADTGSWELRTATSAESDALLSLLAGGGPVIHRPGSPGRRDFPGTEVVQPLDVSRSLSSVAGRVWSFSYEVVDDPDPDVAVSLSTLTDLSNAYLTLTLNTLATDFSTRTLLEVATTDWASL